MFDSYAFCRILNPQITHPHVTILLSELSRLPDFLVVEVIYLY